MGVNLIKYSLNIGDTNTYIAANTNIKCINCTKSSTKLANSYRLYEQSTQKANHCVMIEWIAKPIMIILQFKLKYEATQ